MEGDDDMRTHTGIRLQIPPTITFTLVYGRSCHASLQHFWVDTFLITVTMGFPGLLAVEADLQTRQGPGLCWP